jgi:hypothetical protein
MRSNVEPELKRHEIDAITAAADAAASLVSAFADCLSDRDDRWSLEDLAQDVRRGALEAGLAA